MNQKKVKNNIKFINTISFQNIFVYALILVAFIVYALAENNAINYIVHTATVASTQSLQLETEEAALKADLIHVSAEINKNLGQLEGGSKLTKDDFADYDSYVADIENRISNIEANPVMPQVPNGKEIVSNLRAALDTYTEATINMENLILKGDVGGAISIVSTDYGTSLTTAYDYLAQTEEGISALNSTMGEYLTNEQQKGAVLGYVILGIVILLIIGAYMLSYFRINKAVQGISNELSGIIERINSGNGDLTSRITTSTKTELALIKSNINQFLETLQDVIKEVKSGASVLTSSSEDIVSRIKSASDNVTNTSAAMEELAASMESVASDASELTNQLTLVREATDEINNEVLSGTEKANHIKLSADEIKQEAANKKENTGAKMEELSSVLEASVHESEQVNQINDLTNDILDIASKTNLLALNASIEAARAGEAGRGFSVVATEISTLAANSKDAAGNIQEISARVTTAVKELADNANLVIDFIKENVLADYDAFVETGAKYEATAELIEQILMTFSEKANHLNTVMDEMSGKISSISDSVQDSSNAINMSAAAATEMVGEIQGINSAIDQNNDVTRQLNESALKFEIV
jgi:methyl-accepting chemotaxis protein